MINHGVKKFDREYYKRFFDKYSLKEFNKYVNWAYGWVKFLDKYVDFKNYKNKSVLELGSSLGYFARIFKNRGFDVSASDISSYIVKKASLLQKDIRFFKLNIEENIKQEKQFDFILAFEVMEHLKNPKKALINIKKMLKKDGMFIFSTPFPSKNSLSDPTHINVHEAAWWMDLGKKTGFSNARHVYATFIPFFYRISKYLSFGFPIKTNLPYINSTSFIFLKKFD